MNWSHWSNCVGALVGASTKVLNLSFPLRPCPALPATEGCPLSEITSSHLEPDALGFILMIYSILTIPSGEAVLTYSEPMSWRRRRLLSWRSGSGLTRLAGMSGCRTVGQSYSTVSAWHWYIWAGFLLPHVASVPCRPLHYTLLIGFVVSRQSCFTCANFTVQAFKDSQRCKKPFTLMVAAFPPMSHVRACQSLILQMLVAPWRQHRQRFPWFPDLRTPQTFWLPKSNQVLLRGLIYKIVKDQIVFWVEAYAENHD